MDNCLIDNGIAQGCSTIAGVSRVWIGNYDQDVTYKIDSGTSIVSELVNNDNEINIYNFAQDIEFAGLTQNIIPSRENGTVYLESILSVKFVELDSKLRNTVLALSKAPLYAVVESNAGQFYIAGVESSGRLSEGAAGLGVAMGDHNGATLSITWKSKNGVYIVNKDILNSTGTPDATKITVEATV